MTNAPAQQWLPQAGVAPAPSGPPLPWEPSAGFFYAGIADEDGPTVAAKQMRDDVDAYWDDWEERCDLHYAQLVPTWWSEKRQRLDFFYRKSQAPATPFPMPDGTTQMLNPWQLQQLFYEKDFVADQADFLKLREQEAAGQL